MVLSPGRFMPIPQEPVISAARIRVLLGRRGWQLFWETTNPADTYDIMQRTGGETESSIPGFVRIKDWIPRNSSVETWSDYSCILDQPIEGDFQFGDLRFNLMVAARELARVVELPYA